MSFLPRRREAIEVVQIAWVRRGWRPMRRLLAGPLARTPFAGVPEAWPERSTTRRPRKGRESDLPVAEALVDRRALRGDWNPPPTLGDEEGNRVRNDGARGSAPSGEVQTTLDRVRPSTRCFEHLAIDLASDFFSWPSTRRRHRPQSNAVGRAPAARRHDGPAKVESGAERAGYERRTVKDRSLDAALPPARKWTTSIGLDFPARFLVWRSEIGRIPIKMFRPRKADCH